ncbi:hypothetical protein KR215_003217 [Drosophila sulfurigaster]|nr:hypothetical protein KR215_003217 [Drosophila sulfurigaster]
MYMSGTNSKKTEQKQTKKPPVVQARQQYSLRSRQRIADEKGAGKSVKMMENKAEKKESKTTQAEMSKITENNEMLQQLVQLLTLKIRADETQKDEGKLVVENFEKIIPEFDGNNMQVVAWFQNFELNADAYGLSDKQKYVQARAKMTRTAALFLESTAVFEYNTLRTKLIEEFAKGNVSSAEINRKLAERVKHKDESFHDYLLQMKCIAARGVIDIQSVIKYVVDGLNLKSDFKFTLYGCSTFKELREKYEVYESNQTNEKEEKRQNQPSKNKYSAQPKTEKKQHCFNCGANDHLRKNCQSEVKCFRCNENGHMSRNCKAAPNMKVVYEDRRLKKLRIGDVVVEALVDTGADVSIIKEAVVNKISGVKLQQSVSTLRGLGRGMTRPLGQFNAEVKIDEMQLTHRFLVVPQDAIACDALLGYDFVAKFRVQMTAAGYEFSPPAGEETVESNQLSILNILETNTDIDTSPQYKGAVETMIGNFNAMKKTAECPIQLKIVPDANIMPFRQAPSRIAVSEAEAVKHQINEWLDTGVIRQSTSNFASRLVVVKKKDGSNRICVDYRQLNKMVLKDCFPVPVIDDVLEKLQKAKFFTVMDLENGFFHVPVEENSKKFTAFITKEGLFEFNQAPFGFRNSPAIFIRFVNHVFQKLINEDVLDLYMDDIIIHAVTADECLRKMERVFNKSAEFGLKIKWKKCHFLQTKIHFLGHIIEDGKIKPGIEKTKAIGKFPAPQNIKALQSFLGLIGFFRKFIRGCSQIAKPLTDLLRKDESFRMGSAELQSLQKLKDALTSEPVLIIYDRDASTELHTDASKDGFGVTLLQWYDDQLYPVCYWSKKTTEAESRKHSYILEAKAVYLALKKFRQYLLGISFKLIIDCAAFKQTLKKQDVPRDVAEWVVYMEQFDFEVEHRPGNRLKHVDCLSRYPPQIMVISTEISARLKKAQESDAMVKAILEILSSRPYEDFKIKGCLLYKAVEGTDVLVVPKVIEKEIITEAHKAGHFGTQKTMHSIQQNYWIPHLEGKVSKVISNCVKCIIYNKKLGKKEGFLYKIDKGAEPLYTVHVDHLGVMDVTIKQYKHIFAIVDGFTKFVWLYPTKTTSSEEVLQKLRNWSDVFGNPCRIISDRGSAFTSAAFESYVKENGIEHIWSTTGVPRGNGQVERVNRSILAIISKLSADKPDKWFKFVPKVQRVINGTTHKSTKRSPCELMFGVKMRNDADCRILQMLDDEMYNSFDEERQKTRQEAKDEIQHAQDNYKKAFDKNRKNEHGYKLGDLVAIRRTQFVAGRKLASEYLGPYEVTKMKRSGRYEVRKVGNTEGPINTATSVDNMKLWRYAEVNEEAWSSEADD